MTIYYSLTFMLLAAEMITFCVLVMPLPYAIRKRVFTFLSESPIVGKLTYALKISFIFVGILFFDALQRMFRVTAEVEMARGNPQSGATDTHTSNSLAAKKFYAQRNTYLTGFCLFLSLVLTRTFYILLDLIHTQGEYAKLKKATAESSKNGIATQDQSKQIEDLKNKLDAKNRDFDILKKQSGQNAVEYDRLATKYNTETGQVSDKRKD